MEKRLQEAEFLGFSCIYPRMAPQPMKESCLLTTEPEKPNGTLRKLLDIRG